MTFFFRPCWKFERYVVLCAFCHLFDFAASVGDKKDLSSLLSVATAGFTRGFPGAMRVLKKVGVVKVVGAGALRSNILVTEVELRSDRLCWR